MHVVIATFEAPRHAEAFSKALRDDFGDDAHVTADARIGAYGEAYDGHRLVVAWVPRQRAEEVRARAERLAGVLHEPPAHVAPPVGVAPPAPPSRAVPARVGELPL